MIHTSDTHLGIDWHPELAADAFRTVAANVSRLGGNALLIVGDVFDNARISDEVLSFFLEQVGDVPAPVIVLPGNHDLYDDNSLYHREPFREAPANLHILARARGELFSLPELTLDLWGRAMPSHTPEFRPLHQMPVNNNGNWLVALATGTFTLITIPTCGPRRSSPRRWPRLPAITWPWAIGTVMWTFPRGGSKRPIPGHRWGRPTATIQ